MNKYSKYKVSGNEILEMEIPAHWEMIRLKYVSGITNSNVDKHSFEDEEPVLLCNYTDVYYNEYIDDSIQFMQATATSEEIRKFTLNAGDVLITKDSEEPDDIAVAAYVKSPVKGLLCGYHLALIRPDENKIDGKYLFRAFKTSGINEQFQIDAQGITRYGLSKYGIDNSLFPVPPLKEQQSIASYLDRKTALIDNLVSIKKKQIELLKEERTAIINQAVTKGLNPEAKMKDSGIEWLGEIPEHWEMRKVSRSFSLIGSGTTPKSDEISYYEDGDINWIITGDLNDGLLFESSKKITKKALNDYSTLKIYPCGTLLIAMYGATIGKVSIIGIEGCTNQACCALHGGDLILNKFAYYWFIANKPNVISLGYGGGQPNISQDLIRNLKISTPPISEQHTILDYLDSQTAKIDKSISDAEKQIEFLKEYRMALISEAVTGKIDVR